MRAANGYPRPRAADARAADNGSGWDKSFHLANSLGTRSVFKRDAPTTVRESSLSSPGFRSRRVSQPAPTGFAPVQLGRARPVSAGAGVRPPLDSIALLQMAAAQRLAAANAESLAGTSAAARPAQRTASLSLTFPPNFPHVARPARTARSAGGSRATPLLAGRVARGGVASAGPARSFSESRLEPAAFPSARDALARDGELLELRLAELQAETAREQAEARALGARVRMQAMAEAEVDAHLAALRTVLATVSADVRLCTAERAAAAKAAMQATRAAATVAEPAALGAAQAAEVAARRARAHASIRALGPAIGSFVAWADELGLGEGGGGGDSGDSGDSGDDGGGDDGARGGGAARAASAEGAGEAGSTPTSPASRVSPLIASARARLLRVDSMLRNVSEVQRAATLLQRAAGQHGGLADEAEAAGGGILANAMVLTPEGRAVPAREVLLRMPVVLTPEGRAVPAREVLLRMPPPLPPAGLEPEAGAQRRSGGGGGSRPPDRVARRAARLKAAAAASARAGERPAGDGEIGDGDGDGATRRVTPLPTMLAELHATAEEASLLAAHMRSLSGQRDALARAQSFRQLDADGDGFLNDTELAQLPAALGLPPFLLARLCAGALGLGTSPTAAAAQFGGGGGDVELAAAAAQRDALLTSMGAGARPSQAGLQPVGHSGVRLSLPEFGALCEWLLGPTRLARNLALWFRALDMDGDGILSGADVLAAFEAAAASGAASAPPGSRPLDLAWRPVAEGLVVKLLAAKAGALGGRMGGGAAGRGRLCVSLAELFQNMSVATVFARDAIGALRRLLRLRLPEGEEEEEEGDEGAPPLTSRST